MTKVDINKSFLLDFYVSHERDIGTAIRMAYRDFQRVVEGMGAVNEDVKKKYKEDISKIIKCKITQLPAPDANTKKTVFDCWHYKTCDDIVGTHPDGYESINITYGIAQKWLNMTIKNMVIYDICDNKLMSYYDCFHVPVDKIIMAAVTDDKNMQIKLPLRPKDENGKTRKYNKDEDVSYFDKCESYLTESKKGFRESKYYPWSEWNYHAYKNFQDSLYIALSGKQYPIDWELETWPKMRDIISKMQNISYVE